jgi:hypothetical protein
MAFAMVANLLTSSSTTPLIASTSISEKFGLVDNEKPHFTL